MTEKKQLTADEREEILVRILGHDIPGNKSVYTGLTRIKGISWSIANALCTKLAIPKEKKIKELDKDTIKKIETTLENFDIPEYLKNRRHDFDTGDSKHLLGVKLDLKREFDIKRLRQIKSYRGDRHARRLPVRGQRTRSHFRKSGIIVGVRKPKVGKKS